MAEMDTEQQQQYQQMRPGEIPAGYFWHTECAKETCIPEPQTIKCPPSAICKPCGTPDDKERKCPEVSILYTAVNQQGLW